MKELLKKDIALQWRQGFWLVYFLVSLVYVIILLNIPRASRQMVSLLMILSDTSMLGILFMGALILLEKQLKVSHALFVSPLEPAHYIWSKCLSLTLIAVTMSILIYLPNWHVDYFSPLLLLAVAMTALGFALFGLGIAVRLETINQYFGQLLFWYIFLMLPVVPYLLLDRHAAFLVLPYIASLDLLMGSMEALPVWRIIADALLILLWLFLAFRFARSRVNKFLVHA